MTRPRLLLYAALAGALLAPAGLHADEDTRRLQQALKDQGFYYGTVDGNPGAETAQAIKRFQIRNSLPVSGNLDEETRRAIEGGASAPRPTPPPAELSETPAPPRRATPPPVTPRAPRPTAPPEDYGAPGGPPPPPTDGLSAYRGGSSIFVGGPYQSAPPFVQAATLGRVQGLLGRQGFYNGPADGIPGRRSSEALAAFQEANGLRVTGRLDHQTANALGIVPVYDERREAPRRPPRQVPRGPRYEGNGVYEGRIVPETAPR